MTASAATLPSLEDLCSVNITLVHASKQAHARTRAQASTHISKHIVIDTHTHTHTHTAVSYTHLTLPTKIGV